MASTLSSLAYALLALVAKQPSSGYDLARRARRPLGYFWTGRYGQIHPQLRDLTQVGLLTVEAVPGPGPHDKRIYSITDAGRAALAAWVVELPVRDPARDEFLLKVYAIWVADPTAARTMVLDQAEKHRQRLAELTAIQVPDVPANHPDFGSMATLRYGIGYERHRAEWCDWLAATLERSGRRHGGRGRQPSR